MERASRSPGSDTGNHPFRPWGGRSGLASVAAMEARVRTWCTALLAAGLLVAGLVSSTGLHDDQSPSAVYRTGTLLLGGAMVLGGSLVRRQHDSLGTAVLVVGAVAGIVVGLETVVLPLLIIVVVVLTLRDQTRQPHV